MKKVVLRFMVCSDLHYRDPDCVEKKRFEEGLRQLYAYADGEEYSRVDAVYIVGDFATSGTMEQMRLVKESLDACLRPETLVNLCLASHEYHGPDGEAGARRRFDEVFAQPADTHWVIQGFHFISVSTTEGCHFREPQLSFVSRELESAHNDTPRKPIFFFQHPHLTDTVYGSIGWGEAALMPILVNYPQIIDFSGHSHAPINDPRSIHQDHLTSVGTGTFSYFELDEFDKIYTTFPPEKEQAAQMQIVEAFDDGSVMIKPYDVISGTFFHNGWLVEKPWDPDSFIYTREKRIREAEKPHFPENAVLHVEQTEDGLHIIFDHACGGNEDVNDYVITIRNQDGIVDRRFVLWSPYFLVHRPVKMEYTTPGFFPKLKEGIYTVTVKARGFWYNTSDDRLEIQISIGTD